MLIKIPIPNQWSYMEAWYYIALFLLGSIIERSKKCERMMKFTFLISLYDPKKVQHLTNNTTDILLNTVQNLPHYVPNETVPYKQGTKNCISKDKLVSPTPQCLTKPSCTRFLYRFKCPHIVLNLSFHSGSNNSIIIVSLEVLRAFINTTTTTTTTTEASPFGY